MDENGSTSVVVALAPMAEAVEHELRLRFPYAFWTASVDELVRQSPRWPHEVRQLLVFAPPPPAESDLGDPGNRWWPPMAERLRALFTLLRSVAGAAGQSASRDRSVVVVSDAHAAIGAPEAVLGSAFVGAVISMVRTAAVELASRRVWVNCVLADTPTLTGAPDAAVSPRALAGVVDGLLRNHGEGVTGQEVFAAGGRSTGRLLP